MGFFATRQADTPHCRVTLILWFRVLGPSFLFPGLRAGKGSFKFEVQVYAQLTLRAPNMGVLDARPAGVVFFQYT